MRYAFGPGVQDSFVRDFCGIKVVVSPTLPLDPSPGQDARRIVRHGLADVLDWLGEDVGAMPGEKTHMLMIGRNMALASAAFIGKMAD